MRLFLARLPRVFYLGATLLLALPVLIALPQHAAPQSSTGPFVFTVDPAQSSVHWTLGDVISSTLDAAVAADRAEASDERERLLYVACTRALDLLVLPSPSWTPDGGCAKFFDLRQSELTEMVHPSPQPVEPPLPSRANDQTAAIFAAELERIDQQNARIEWYRPSLADVDR